MFDQKFSHKLISMVLFSYCVIWQQQSLLYSKFQKEFYFVGVDHPLQQF